MSISDVHGPHSELVGHCGREPSVVSAEVNKDGLRPLTGGGISPDNFQPTTKVPSAHGASAPPKIARDTNKSTAAKEDSCASVLGAVRRSSHAETAS